MKDDNQQSYEFLLYDCLIGVNTETEPAEKQLLLFHGKRELPELSLLSIVDPLFLEVQ